MKMFKLAAFLLVLAVVSGCSEPAAKAEKEASGEAAKSEIELVPARKSEEDSSKTVVVERDGKYYELLKEHERICSDCDK